MKKLYFIVITSFLLGCSAPQNKTEKQDLTQRLAAQMEYAIQLADAAKDSNLVSPRNTFRRLDQRIFPG